LRSRRRSRLNDKTYACDILWRRESWREDPAITVANMPIRVDASVEALFYDTLQLDNIEILDGVFPEETGGKVET
jgi:hypothetical protein